MEITQMTRAHVAQIAALEGQCFADPWSERSVASELENPLSLWLVALEDGTVAGYVGSQSVLGEADMMNLAVAPAYRRRGSPGRCWRHWSRRWTLGRSAACAWRCGRAMRLPLPSIRPAAIGRSACGLATTGTPGRMP